jgi:hypothetical protein
MSANENKTTIANPEEIEDCRATNIGVAGFAECLCTGPTDCAYALPFGYAFLCRHPRMGEIVANTQRAKAAAHESN